MLAKPREAVALAVTVTYSYDDLNRMTQAVATNVASGQSTYTQNFTYNAISNITAGPVGSYTYAGNSGTNYANPHAATSINSVTNTYDHDGNVLTDGILTNTWNYKDQLATSTNGIFIRTYKYDQDGNRVSSDDGTNVTVYPNKYYTYDGTTKTKDIYAGDTLVATITTTGSTVTPQYVHTDHLGSVAVVSDSSGAQVSLTDYFPYGNTRISSGSYTSARQYLGERFDSDTSYSYLQARYLRSSIGQFISEDPQFWKFDNSWLQDPQNQNSYSYGRDNPITNKDPDGKISFSVTQFLPEKTQVNIDNWANNLANTNSTFNYVTGHKWVADAAGDVGVAAGAGAGILYGGSVLGIQALQTLGSTCLAFCGKTQEVVSQTAQTASMSWPGPENGRQIINGIQYSEHALARMMPEGMSWADKAGNIVEGRGIPPSVVENAISAGTKGTGYDSAITHTFENVKVITNAAANIIRTVIKIGK